MGGKLRKRELGVNLLTLRRVIICGTLNLSQITYSKIAFPFSQVE